MRKLLPLLLLGAPLWGAITVTITGVKAISHSSATVEGIWNGDQPHYMRGRISAANGSCTSGSGGTVTGFQVDNGHEAGLNDLNWYPYENHRGTPHRFRTEFSPMAAKTTYQLCPEFSTDNSTWTTGYGVNVTTTSLPAVHPAIPIAPAAVDTTFPDISGYALTTSANCGTIQADINAAAQLLLSAGNQKVTIPSGCDWSGSNPLTFTAHFPDVITFATSGVNVAANTISGWTYPGSGGTCGGAAHVACLAEGQQVKFGNVLQYYTNAPPQGLRDYGADSGAGVIPYLFYVHLTDSTHFQLYYPQSFAKCGAPCLWNLQTQGTGTIGFVEWPRSAMGKLVIRTVTAEGSFAPPGTRLTPAWVPQMTTQHFFKFADHTEAGAGVAADVMAGNVIFEGIHSDYPDNGERSPNPVTWNASGGVNYKTIVTQQDSGPITFDRDWFEGPDAYHRVASPFVFDGTGNAMVNTRIDKMHAWHPSSTYSGIFPLGPAGIVNTFGTNTFTIGAGEVHAGPAFNCVLTSPMTVTLSGTPTAGIKVTNFAYCDQGGVIKIALPTGMTATVNQGGVVVAGNNTYVPDNSLSSAALQRDAQGRAQFMPIALYDILANGNIDYLTPAETFNSSCDWQGCEGSDTIIAGRGPGPLKMENNYFDWNGNFFNADDCLRTQDGDQNVTCGLDTGDYTFVRNYFYHAITSMRGYPGWNGTIYQNRQGIEGKKGSRWLIRGNIMDGPNGCDDQNPDGNAFLAKTAVRESDDYNVEFNTNRHSCGFSGFGNYTGTQHRGTDVQKRLRYANNLLYDISGWRNSSYFSTRGSGLYLGQAGWLFRGNGPSEDVVIDHNTLGAWDGLKVSLLTGGFQAEGHQITNNVWFEGVNGGSTGAMIYYNDNASGTAAGCSSSTDKAFLDCMISGYDMRKNLVLPGFDSSNIYSNGCVSFDGGGTPSQQALCPGRASMTASSQTNFTTLCTNWGGTVSGTCSGGLASTNYVINAVGVQTGINALKWTVPGAIGLNDDRYIDYLFRYDSPGNTTYLGTDGKPVGADIVALRNAQGVVQNIGATGVTTTAATVSFVAPDTQSCPVDYGLQSGDPTLITSFTRVSDSGVLPGKRGVSLSGLTTNSVYVYRINCAVMQPMGTFKTR